MCQTHHLTFFNLLPQIYIKTQLNRNRNQRRKTATQRKPLEKMMSGRGYSKEPVKVVIISTEYVQTDAGSFKSVVQKLTGKDSHHYHHHHEEEDDPSQKQDSILEAKAHQSHHEVSANGGSSRVFIRDVSFKEFDKMLREMPPIHEIWSDYNQ